MKFKAWLKLEGLKEKAIKAVGTDEFPVRILEFVSAALSVPVKHIQDAEWIYVVRAFHEIVMKSPPVQLPITEPTYEQFNSDSWDYEGRTWHLYAHLLASTYGWSFEYISQLKVLDALATIQEIMTDKQLEKEFQYGLSEIAYPYNSQTKKNEFHPMTRPAWMRPKIQPIKKIKMPVSVLPVGVVDYAALPEEYRPQPSIN